MANLLEVTGLKIEFTVEGKTTVPVRGVDFFVPEHGKVALVGESGCGKSLTALALAGLPPTDRARVSGRIEFSRTDGGRSRRRSYSCW